MASVYPKSLSTYTQERVRLAGGGTMFDLLIRNARVIDGAGNPWFRADVGIEQGTITEVGAISPGTAAQRLVDADDVCLAPGFIDIHTHSDFTLPSFPRAESMIAQGVTTEVTGNCGFTPYPISPDRLELLQSYAAFMAQGLTWDWTSAEEYLSHLDSLPLSHNVVPLLGHGAVRIAVLGFENRPPNSTELERMQSLVAEAFEQGVVGLSSGLIYTPGAYADMQELVALCRVVKRFGGFYSTHLRNEADELVAAVEEALTIGREAGVPVQLSHHKVMGEKNWGTVDQTLDLVDKATAAGQDVTLDQYPYTGSSTTFLAFLPAWSLEGGIESLLGRLNNPAQCRRIRDEAERAKPMNWDKVLVAAVSRNENEQFLGATIEEVGRKLGLEGADAGLELLRRENGPFSIIRFGMSEEDVERVMRHPQVMVASDGHALNQTSTGLPHPRNFGTFARVLGKYVREEENLNLEEAVRKMTSLPARRIGLRDRGLIRPGFVADLVLFRAEEIGDQATFDEPHRYAAGVKRVWVGGVEIWNESGDTGAAAGRVLRRESR